MGVGEDWLDEPAPSAGAREPYRIVAVGSLVPKKGHDVLVDAVARTREPWRLDVIGDGPERGALEQRIAALGLSGRVRLLGALPEDEVRARLRRASVAALACAIAPDGDRDGIPVALVEAMACGTPVVTTRVSGIPELVEGAGVLVEPGDVMGLARALDRLSDATVRERMGARGRARVEAEFRAGRAAALIRALVVTP
jgi:glycosyltransferase involved in cell wall biosynthesis